MPVKDYPQPRAEFKSFVYSAVRFVEGRGEPALEVEVHARANRGPVCSGCGQSGPGVR